MKKLLCCTAIAFFAMGTQAMAQNYDDKSQADLNIESYEKYQKADKELNKVYKQLTSKLSKKEKDILVKGQRAWITYRDSDCNLVSGIYEGGSIQPLIENGCMLDRTNQRIKELKEMLEEFEGN